MEYVTIDAAGLRWDIRPLDPDEQIEVECILLRAFGPAASAAVAALVQGLAPALVSVLRETAGEGESFDIARLASLDTADPRIQTAWGNLLDALGETAGDLVREGVGMFTARLDHREIFRLFELALLSRKALAYAPGKDKNSGAWVADYKTLGELTRRDPKAKWDLLAKALGVTYGAKADGGEAATE